MIKRSLALLFFLSPLFCLANDQKPSAKPATLALTHVTVIDTAPADHPSPT
jgi:hypothetical protein